MGGILMRLHIMLAILFIAEHISCQTIITTRKSRVKFHISDSTVSFNKRVNGEKEGWWIKNYFPGRIRRVCHYKNGKKDGNIIVFYMHGGEKMSGKYKDGKKHGIFHYADLPLKDRIFYKKMSHMPENHYEYENGIFKRKIIYPSEKM